MPKYRVKMETSTEVKTYSDKQMELLAKAEESQVISLSVKLTKSELKKIKDFMQFKSDASNEIILQGLISSVVKNKIYHY